jgi:DNA-directed RNA polymerase specialized sigma subunit
LQWATKEEMEKHQQKSPAVIAYRSLNRKQGHKLTDTIVKKIKQMVSDKKRKMTLKEIAAHFEISEMQLYRIKSGENWGHVKA